MVYETLQILKEQLDNYLDDAGLGKIVVLENLALLDSGSDKAKNLEGKVIISLLSVQEESTLKNLPTSHVVNNKAEYYNPAVNINLFFMVSANCDMYSNSLISITKTLEYFQGKKVFTAQNTAYNRSNVSMQELDDFKFVVDLYTPGFEVWNHIWGTHGGRQLPSVIYKVQLLQVDRRKKQAGTELITKIKGNLKDIN
ncbi:DUF4255 domain-containing protein [Draconibacterium sediminis]|uniref:Pvc16 N-terminal domain-containing protein n=1 Tax=Draconibacterium sediminis TaxID=1544798 RepID=A0A0D8JA50_9BACT|nr:DUF4255 domain-containing protein [Draconibacterium sediminis]KJF43767.1 hypothetical protein LH29_11850 [Draconibacterium sediminis]